mmetsp:Transcript_10783/g.34664  ORF Transcript_10783/g.34664 Transcript_10783/m.34664 type:complete len:204 (-) Transcript_10783:278-889(-)
MEACPSRRTTGSSSIGRKALPRVSLVATNSIPSRAQSSSNLCEKRWRWARSTRLLPAVHTMLTVCLCRTTTITCRCGSGAWCMPTPTLATRLVCQSSRRATGSSATHFGPSICWMPQAYRARHKRGSSHCFFPLLCSLSFSTLVAPSSRFVRRDSAPQPWLLCFLPGIPLNVTGCNGPSRSGLHPLVSQGQAKRAAGCNHRPA